MKAKILLFVSNFRNRNNLTKMLKGADILALVIGIMYFNNGYFEKARSVKVELRKANILTHNITRSSSCVRGICRHADGPEPQRDALFLPVMLLNSAAVEEVAVDGSVATAAPPAARGMRSTPCLCCWCFPCRDPESAAVGTEGLLACDVGASLLAAWIPSSKSS